MSKLITAALLVGLGLASPVLAARSPKWACVSACNTNGQVAATCSGVRPYRFSLCRSKLYRQCMKWGVDSMCPSPPPTTTVPPPPVVTTTVPYIPPTTTTVPQTQLGPWSGTWDFYGALYITGCPQAPVGNTLAEEFYVAQQGNSVAVTAYSVPGLVLTGYIDSSGGFTVSGSYMNGSCLITDALSVEPSGNVILTTDSAGVGVEADCPTGSCTVGFTGTVTFVGN